MVTDSVFFNSMLSIGTSVKDTMAFGISKAIRDGADTQNTIWGLSPDWGAVLIPTVASIIIFIIGHIIERKKQERK